MANLKNPFAKIQRCSSLAGKHYHMLRDTNAKARPPKKEYLAAYMPRLKNISQTAALNLAC